MGFNSGFKGLMKIRPMKAQLFHADGRTDMTKRMVACRNFANASKTLVCVHDLMILSVTCTIPIASNDQVVKNELEWKNLRYCPSNCVEGISKTVEDPQNQNGQISEIPL